MAKELLSRKCSHCGHNGHNSRTCSRVVKLFGVKLTAIDGDFQMRKSVSTGNLIQYPGFSSMQAESGAAGDEGYLSDGLLHTSSKSRDRKKGVPWSEEEHRLFLAGLEKLGKGDWRGISRNFVTTRTPTQVASHAQKYFLRQSSLPRRKRRSSLFDMCPHTQNVTGFSIRDGSLENPHESSPNLSGDLELSAEVVPNLSLSISAQKDGENMANSQPQVLLALWPELKHSSNSSRNSIEMEDVGEQSELSLSIAPPSGNTKSAQYYFERKQNFPGNFMTNPATIRVV